MVRADEDAQPLAVAAAVIKQVAQRRAVPDGELVDVVGTCAGAEVSEVVDELVRERFLLRDDGTLAPGPVLGDLMATAARQLAAAELRGEAEAGA